MEGECSAVSLGPMLLSLQQKLFESGDKKSYILSELSHILNGLGKEHRGTNNSLLTYKHFPCCKVIVHSITKP